MIARRVFAFAVAAGLGTAIPGMNGDTVIAAEKQPYSGCRYITVQSRYDLETVSGCVRHGPRGPEVRLPGGAWIPCRFGCANTLRSQTIDFYRWIEENSSGR